MRPIVWPCDPSAIVCLGGHVTYRCSHGYKSDDRRLSGHRFLKCEQCRPHSFFLGVYGLVQGLATVTCYQINKESYDQWTKGDAPTPETPELLYLLRGPDGESLNPGWRPR